MTFAMHDTPPVPAILPPRAVDVGIATLTFFERWLRDLEPKRGLIPAKVLRGPLRIKGRPQPQNCSGKGVKVGMPSGRHAEQVNLG